MSRSVPFPTAPVRRGLAIAAALSLLGVGAFASRAVHAAVIEGAVTEITVTPTNPRPNDPIRTTIAWCVPDGTQEGDTFSIEMPEQLGGFPPSFPLTDPSGELVATATIGGDPVTAIFTMTDYAETHIGVCGDAFFESRLTADDVANTTQTLTYVVNGSITFERVIEIGRTTRQLRLLALGRVHLRGQHLVLHQPDDRAVHLQSAAGFAALDHRHHLQRSRRQGRRGP